MMTMLCLQLLHAGHPHIACSTAGRSAMGQHAVAQALLSPQMVVTRVSTKQPADKDEPIITGYSRGWAWEPVRKILAATGLSMCGGGGHCRLQMGMHLCVQM